MIVDPKTLKEDVAYRLMTSAFIPRPIAFVSTRGRNGVDNCAPSPSAWASRATPWSSPSP